MEERRSSAGSRAVEVRDNVVVKRQEPGASRKERLRTLAGRKVGLETGLFTVPDVLSYDDARGEIVFERLQLTGLRVALTDPVGGMEMAGGAAQVLAAIHGRMELAEAAPGVTGPTGTGGHRELVPLHGDFGIANVLYNPPTARIAVIDWSNAGWTGVDADLGAPETDVAVFVMSLFHRRLFEGTRVARRHDAARHFLATYAAAGPYGLDLVLLRQVVARTTPAFVRLARLLKGNIRSLAYRHGVVDLSWFLRRLSHDGLTSHTG